MLDDATRWRDNWRIVARPGSLRVDLQGGVLRRSAPASACGLPAGTPVVVAAAAPAAIGRCRRFAARERIDVECEYLAFPSAASPAYLVEADRAAIRTFLKDVVVAPPRPGAAAAVVAVALAALRALRPWRLLRAAAPGAVIVGRRV